MFRMAMDVGKQCDYWRKGADNALAAAELLIQNGRFDFGLFLLHLSLEKLLKAIVTRETQDVPPKTHNLLFLVEKAKLSPPGNLLAVLSEFREYCMAGRYPDAEPANVDQAMAQRELARAREVSTWLQNQFKK